MLVVVGPGRLFHLPAGAGQGIRLRVIAHLHFGWVVALDVCPDVVLSDPGHGTMKRNAHTRRLRWSDIFPLKQNPKTPPHNHVILGKEGLEMRYRWRDILRVHIKIISHTNIWRGTAQNLETNAN